MKNGAYNDDGCEKTSDERIIGDDKRTKNVKDFNLQIKSIVTIVSRSTVKCDVGHQSSFSSCMSLHFTR